MPRIINPDRMFRLPRFTYLGLLLFLILFFILTPFFGEGAYARFALDISLVYLLAVTVYMCSNDTRYLYIALLLVSPSLLRFLYATPTIDAVTLFFNCCFFAFVIYALLRALFTSSRITEDIIFSAISIYILLGVFCGLVFTLLEYYIPGSFVLEKSGGNITFYEDFGQDMIYFSFSTLTTLGYGDILPLSQPARFLSVLEAVIAQVYLTVIIARLIGLHLKHKDN